MVGACYRGLAGLLLVAAAAAVELFDEVPAAEDDVYQSENDIDTDLRVLRPQKEPSSNVADHELNLYRFLKTLQKYPWIQSELSSNRFLKEVDARQPHRERFGGPMTKRYAGFFTNSAKMSFNPYFGQAQKKKAQICYFKLCSLGHL